MTYQPPYHHTEKELAQANLDDARVELNCAKRDELPVEYILYCEGQVDRCAKDLAQILHGTK